MFCSNCGQENPEGALFCSGCGHKLDAQSPGGAPNRQETRTYGMPSGVSVKKTTSSIASARDYLSSVGTSYLYLAAVICYSLVIVTALFRAGRGTTSLERILNIYQQQFGYGNMDVNLNQIFPFLNSFHVVGTAISLLPTVVVCVGLWLIFVHARDGFRSGYTGLTIINIVEWINLVIAVLGTVVIAIVLLVISVKAEVGFLAAVALFYVAFMALTIFYHWLVIKAIGNTTGSIVRDQPSVPISMYVIVMTFVLAFTSFVGAISSGGFLTAVLQAAYYIIFGILMLQYNKNMQILLSGRPVEVSSEKINLNMEQQPVQQPVQQPQEYRPTPQQTGPNMPVVDSAPQVPLSAEPEGQTEDSDGVSFEDMFKDENATVVLEGTSEIADEEPKAFLTMADGTKEIPIDTDPFVIGKDPSKTDYAISDDPTVSRIHAQIRKKDGEYYLADLNSTNHTYLNGKMLDGQEEVMLSDQDQIRLARIEVVFHR